MKIIEQLSLGKYFDNIKHNSKISLVPDLVLQGSSKEDKFGPLLPAKRLTCNRCTVIHHTLKNTTYLFKYINTLTLLCTINLEGRFTYNVQLTYNLMGTIAKIMFLYIVRALVNILLLKNKKNIR